MNKVKNLLTGALVFGIAVTACDKADYSNPKLETDNDKASYVVGHNIGFDMQKNGLDENILITDEFIAGFMQGIKGQESAFNDSTSRAIMMTFQQKVMGLQKEKAQKEAEENLAKGEEFLKKNKDKEGVIVTDSGLQYEVLVEGSGATPTAESKVKVNYAGTTIDGEEFDSSYKRGQAAEFNANQVIKGWTEVLQLMKEGAKYKVYVPSDLAYGPQRRSEIIGPNETLIFEIELLEVLD